MLLPEHVPALLNSFGVTFCQKNLNITAAASRLCREFLKGAPNGLKASLWITDFERKKGFWGVN